MFEGDPETEAIIPLGAIGGRLEHDEANFVSHHMKKQVIALIVGNMAPREPRWGTQALLLKEKKELRRVRSRYSRKRG
jgi:succinyl-CoA synthetase alpha subunit